VRRSAGSSIWETVRRARCGCPGVLSQCLGQALLRYDSQSTLKTMFPAISVVASYAAKPNILASSMQSVLHRSPSWSSSGDAFAHPDSVRTVHAGYGGAEDPERFGLIASVADSSWSVNRWPVSVRSQENKRDDGASTWGDMGEVRPDDPKIEATILGFLLSCHKSPKCPRSRKARPAQTSERPQITASRTLTTRLQRAQNLERRNSSLRRAVHGDSAGRIASYRWISSRWTRRLRCDSSRCSTALCNSTLVGQPVAHTLAAICMASYWH
jgi:hypothetical protein